jgi:deazaflavin-dependent oxidoreductase (nitroreductase family)
MANPVNDYNTQIIEEFHANEGKVGGPFDGTTLLLLTHRGAKTGRERTNPLAYIEEDGRYFVFGSKGGASTNPDWYHNLRANPDATIEIGTKKFDVAAEVLTGEERDRVWTRNVRERPAFGDYEKRTSRKIPVIALTRKA